jgi:Protein of unknown function (DUF4031)
MVYVDEGYINFYRVRISLMAADTDEELHEMAKKLGLRKQIFSEGRSHVYYIPEDLRDRAMWLGAELVDRNVILGML